MVRSLAGWIALAFIASFAQAAPDPSLLGHWTFEEGKGVIAQDRSGHANIGEVAGVHWARGEFGTALHFSGKECSFSVPPLKGLDGSDELTVEAWVLWETGGRHPNILTGGQWSPGGFMIFVADKNCSFRMGRPGHQANQPGQAWQEISAPFINGFETGKWYHLAATFKRPAITTYVNGKKIAAAQWDYPVGYSQNLEIGRWHGAQTSHKGLIDEVKIFNRALSAQEVQASFAAESPRRTGANSAAYKTTPAVAEAAVTLENRLASLGIDARARAVSLIEKRSGRNLLAGVAPIATVKIKGQIVMPTACSHADGKLRITFGKDQAGAVIECAAKDQYLVFTVLSVDGNDVESLAFVNLPVQAGKQASSTSGAVVGEEWSVCLRELNLQAQASLGGSPLTLRASCTPQYKLIGAKAGLVVAPPDQLATSLQAMVKNEGVPQSALGGPWALGSEGIRGSYLFTHPSERGIERWIELGQRGGFTHLHFDGWYKTLGHYEPNPKLFPSGLEGMKAMVKKVHDAGLKAGMHTLTGCIQPADSWVTPVPDPRLAADASYTLAAAMDEKSDTILTLEKPQEHDVIWSYSGRGNAIRIGQEIIQYAAISHEPPYAFLKCTRGAFGTKPAAHRKGEAVDHLRQVYLAFYPDERTTLVDEVAEAIARVYNECEFDQIYMDGAEGMGSNHAIQVMRDAIYKRLKRPAIVEASCWDHWSWYYHSRIGAWDHPKWGLKPFTDLHCAAIANYRQGALLQANLGWWVVLGPSAASRAETPDEMEYFCCKTLAFDAPSSTQGIGSLDAPANARMQEYLTMAGWYERLRLANYFPESVKEQLRQPGKDFHLARTTDGQWQLLPTDYLKHKVTGPEDGSTSWTVANRFGAQPLKMRLEALVSVQPYDSADSITIADAAAVDRFTTRQAASGVTSSLRRSTDQVKAGDASLCFTATSKRDTRKGAWTRMGMPFKPYLSIQPCDALGVWIHGDGKGEVLNLQLTTPREYMRAFGEHYITIDFTGWRYVEIPLRERDADRHRDYDWPYHSMAGIYMTPVNRSQIGELNLYLNNLPPGETATVCLGPIKALRSGRTVMSNPVVEVNGQKLSLPVALQSGDYVELHAPDDCRVYNERGILRERLALPGELPALKPGENKFAFSCDRPANGPGGRAELTVIVHGPPLEGRTPAGQVKWQHLKDDYDLPRIITKLDGKQNTWDVTCRAGEKPIPFGVEIDLEEIGTSDAAYNRPEAIPLESFDDATFFAADSAKPVYDATRIATVKPGVTQALTHFTDTVKIGKGCARYTATSTLADNGGWSVIGRRFVKPIDLSKAHGIGFWLHGDGKGEAFKLQLRDSAKGWLDLVTVVNFTGWRYVQFDFAGAGNLDRANVHQLLLYYNSIPANQTVTCLVDDIRAVPASQGLRDVHLAVGTQSLVFPGEFKTGDRIVFDGRTARHYRRGKPEADILQAQGAPAGLLPGANRVTLSFGSATPASFRVAASLVRHYP